jgi:hypothetical protein
VDRLIHFWSAIAMPTLLTNLQFRVRTGSRYLVSKKVRRLMAAHQHAQEIVV